MSCIFSYCSSLTSLNLSNFNTHNVKDMSIKVSSLTSLNLSNFNTHNVKDMSIKVFILLKLIKIKILKILLEKF